MPAHLSIFSKENWEKLLAGALFFVFGLLALVDIYQDAQVGERSIHLAIEGAIAIAAFAATFRIWLSLRATRDQLKHSETLANHLKADSERWKAEAAKYSQGLSRAIDAQLDLWKLTPAEKEIALLLLKGLSHKEIAEVRGTTERTARQQALMIYQKSGLPGRTELSAFFLEDLLISTPQS